MEIVYLGHSAFKIKGKTATVIVDPFDPQFLGLKKSAWKKQPADIVLISHENADHNYLEGIENGADGFVGRGSGEYEVQGVRIFGYPSSHDSVKGAKGGKNTIYLLEIDGLVVVHLGNISHKLSGEVVEELNTVDILMIPVGGDHTINAEAATEIVAELEPAIVLPMHFKMAGSSLDIAPVEKFLEAMGEEKARHEARLKISSRSDLPEETEVVVLNYSQSTG